MAFLQDPTVPVQLNQNSGQQGLDALQRSGVVVNGGSTVSAPGVLTPGSFHAQPGSPTSLVYLGPTKKGTTPPVGSGPYAPGYAPNYTGANSSTFQEQQTAPTAWDAKQLKNFVNKGILYKIPGFGADMGMPEIVDAWQKLMVSAQEYSQGGTDWSPYDVMETYNQKPGAFGTVKSSDGDWLLDARTGEKIKYIGPRSKTTTESRVNLSSPEDVKALTTQMLTQLLGRAPSPKELANYKASMGAFEQAHPETSTTTESINAQGVTTGSSTTTSGGVDDAARQQLITDQAQKGPEYGKFQSATTYFNALMQMMGG